MGYDKEFFRLYADYVQESTVRESHDYAFAVFSRLAGQRHRRIIDLGCGLGEFARYGGLRCGDRYLGIDRHNAAKPNPLQIDDYTDPNFVSRLPFAPTDAVSLFSIEACLPAAERYRLYEGLFERLPKLRLMMTAGFYYLSKSGQETVGETGGIVSYQTVEPLGAFVSSRFDEMRLEQHTPSAMFGDDVIEVWKYLERK